jgi:hypothetical protein
MELLSKLMEDSFAKLPWWNVPFISALLCRFWLPDFLFLEKVVLLV